MTTKPPRNSPRRDPLPHIVPLHRVAPEPVRWLSPGRLAAGKLTLLDGNPGLGKSTLLCDFAARLSRGDPLPGGQPAPPRTVILISAEDDIHDTIRPRIDAAQGDPSRVIAFPTIPARDPHDALLVIPDHNPILEQVIAHTQAAIVAVRHLNKSSAADPLYRGGGSIGLIGAARCALLLALDPGDPQRRILAATKSNLGPLPPSLAFRLKPAPGTGAARVVWVGESPWRAAGLLRPLEDRQQAWSALAEARDWLRDALAAGPRPATELQREALAVGVTRDTLYAARRAEGVRLHKDRTRDGRWSWALPAPPAELPAVPDPPEVPEVPELPEVHSS